MIKRLLSLVIILYSCLIASGQPVDSIPAFSQWSFRLNPFSPLERLGGIHAGVETNLSRRFSFVSEYGWIFLNNFRSSSSGDEKASPVRGFETKQEIRYNLNRSRVFLAVEVHYLSASAENSGWFGMGYSSGQFSYFKYQDFKETTSETSVALKIVHKLKSSKRQVGMEGFAGFGFIHRNIGYENSEGSLYQPDRDMNFNVEDEGIHPYLSIGARILFRLK